MAFLTCETRWRWLDRGWMSRRGRAQPSGSQGSRVNAVTISLAGRDRQAPGSDSWAVRRGGTRRRARRSLLGLPADLPRRIAGPSLSRPATVIGTACYACSVGPVKPATALKASSHPSAMRRQALARSWHETAHYRVMCHPCMLQVDSWYCASLRVRSTIVTSAHVRPPNHDLSLEDL